MAIFEYVATDQSGNSVDGTFEASDENDACNILAQYNPHASCKTGAATRLRPPATKAVQTDSSKTDSSRQKGQSASQA